MKFNQPGYELRFVQKAPCHDTSAHLFTLIYKFYSHVTKYWYVLRVEYHGQNVFALKFYAQQHSKSDLKYSKITNKGDLQNILVTCAKIVPLLLQSYPTASFGLLGARSFDAASKTLEGIRETQRYRVYRYFGAAKFGIETFGHFFYPAISGYLLVNRFSGDTEVREKEIIDMFEKNYAKTPDLL